MAALGGHAVGEQPEDGGRDPGHHGVDPRGAGALVERGLAGAGRHAGPVGQSRVRRQLRADACAAGGGAGGRGGLVNPLRSGRRRSARDPGHGGRGAGQAPAGAAAGAGLTDIPARTVPRHGPIRGGSRRPAPRGGAPRAGGAPIDPERHGTRVRDPRTGWGRPWASLPDRAGGRDAARARRLRHQGRRRPAPLRHRRPALPVFFRRPTPRGRPGPGVGATGRGGGGPGPGGGAAGRCRNYLDRSGQPAGVAGRLGRLPADPPHRAPPKARGRSGHQAVVTAAPSAFAPTGPARACPAPGPPSSRRSPAATSGRTSSTP